MHANADRSREPKATLTRATLLLVAALTGVLSGTLTGALIAHSRDDSPPRPMPAHESAPRTPRHAPLTLDA